MFFGEKLQSIRELQGLSRKELADIVGVSEQAIWQYENKYTAPKFEVINKLKKFFSVRAQFFYTDAFITESADIEKIAYRADDWESRKKVKMELSYINFIDYFLGLFEHKVTGPNTSIISISKYVETMFNKRAFTTDKNLLLKELADYARKALEITDNKELMYKIEMSGIFVLEKNIGPDIDAYSTWTKGNRPLIILGNKKKSAVRRNFDLAHELGHLLFHRRIDMDSLNKEEHQEIEKEANQFASYFLLPEEDFLQDFSLIKKKSNPLQYLEMKAKYLVSVTALEYRAYKLGLLSFEEHRYFYGYLNKKGYRKAEPLDDEIPLVKPGKIRALMAFAFDNKLIYLNELLGHYHIEPVFLESLFGIEQGFLEQYVSNIRNDYHGDKVVKLFG